MRVLRVLGGILVAFVGLAALLAGGVVAFWLVGPDDTIEAEPERLSSKGVAIVLPERLFTYYGPKLHVDVTPEQSDVPLFVGAAHHQYVESYLAETSHTSVAQFTLPQRFAVQELRGERTAVPAPTERPWWREQVDGAGTQRLVWPLPNAPYDVVVMRADGKAGVEVTATLGIELAGAFVTAVLVAVGGLVLLVGGVLLIKGRKRPEPDEPERPAPPPIQRPAQPVQPVQPVQQYGPPAARPAGPPFQGAPPPVQRPPQQPPQQQQQPPWQPGRGNA